MVGAVIGVIKGQREQVMMGLGGGDGRYRGRRWHWRALGCLEISWCRDYEASFFCLCYLLSSI